MRNLLLYVEENLLFSPEQCYQKEHDITNEVRNVNEETSDNAPLISPQSTLEDQNLKFSSQTELSGKSDKSENLQDQVKNNSFPRVAQPFIPQSEPVSNQNKNKISSENLLQLWNENLKLQIQISSIFEILFNKVMNNSETNDNSMKYENNLNTNGNSLKSYPFDIKDVQNLGNLSRDLLNDNSNIDNYTNVLQHSLKQLNTLYSGIAVVDDSNLNKASQLFSNRSSMSRIPPGFEKVSPKVNFNLPNQCMNTVNIDLPETFEKPASFAILLKETNPFKADLINKLQKSQEEKRLNSGDLFSSKKNQEPVIKHDIPVFKENNIEILNANLDIMKKFSATNPFGCQQYYSTCQLSNTDNIDTNPKFLSTEYPRPNVTSNAGIVSNSFSTMLGVNDLHGATNQLETESENRFFSENYDAYKYTPSYLRIRSQEHEQEQEETVVLKNSPSTTTPCTDHALSYDNNCTTTSWLPINSFPSPVVAIQDSKNIDEGYLTRPSTLDRLSPLTQKIADADQYSAFPKIWPTSTADKSAQSEKCHSVPVDILLDHKAYIKLIELPNRQVHVVHYQKEGWLLIEEFILFTNLQNVAYMFDILRILDFSVPIVELDRTQCSIECLESISNCKQQTTDIVHGSNNLCLIQLRSTLKLLKKLKIISVQELNDVLAQNKFESGSVLHEIWIILRAYGQFKYCIESRE